MKPSRMGAEDDLLPPRPVFKLWGRFLGENIKTDPAEVRGIEQSA